ncbi:enoyl-CoA hydratase/isomerase family protein [Pseudomonas sp. BN414]|uniref:enoyl-CoA hydratase/isomerase family protein n=1 Tax=Pseudomonas sp. BN414 TaxID=2567888 RepID=UPI002456DD6B|nr:enoyl-CoA hydratase/isomerase family protein [Pseudomonas sp. BN414]MDH4565223.1 enoyl-CoA hydratase/isomerase family protein [Pseudomonas sp. BN414]
MNTTPESTEEDLSQSILYEVIDGHIARITLNRPHRKNAILTPDMNDMLSEAFTKAQDDDEIKVIILAGNGSDFCSGEDTKKMPVEAFGLKKGGRLGQSKRMRGIRKLLDSTLTGTVWGDKVVILAAQGAVLGQGFSFAMTADILILSEDAYVARRQSRIGFAGFETQLPMTMLRLGLNRGMEILLTGRKMSAQELKEWGVANSVVPREKLEDEALRYARAVAAHSTDNLMLGKRALQQYFHGLGVGAFLNFATVGHPLFSNVVWREDEINFLKERDRVGGRQAMQNLNKVWDDLGFD